MSDAGFWCLWLVGVCAGVGIGAGFMYVYLTRDADEDSVEEFECARRALEPRVLR